MLYDDMSSATITDIAYIYRFILNAVVVNYELLFQVVMTSGESNLNALARIKHFGENDS